MLEENKNTRKVGKDMGKMKTIAMMYEDGHSFEEIAKAVNTKPSTFYALLHKRTDTYCRRYCTDGWLGGFGHVVGQVPATSNRNDQTKARKNNRN